MENNTKSITFWGVELNEEEKKSHRLSYGTMAKTFDAVLCNNIVNVDPDIFGNLESGDFSLYYIRGEEVTREEYEEQREQVQNAIDGLSFEEWETEEQEEIARNHIDELEKELADDFEEIEQDIFQYFIVNEGALWVLKRANEIVFYSEKLDCYIWGVTHWGTSWDYVLTSLRLKDDFSSLED